jgi:hypothetical protein
VIGVACDVAADVATGLARTVCAATSTLAVAVLAEASAAHDPGLEPSGPPWVPAAPSPFAELPPKLLEDLARREAAFFPWLAFDDCAGCLAELDDRDGPEVSP